MSDRSTSPYGFVSSVVFIFISGNSIVYSPVDLVLSFVPPLSSTKHISWLYSLGSSKSAAVISKVDALSFLII